MPDIARSAGSVRRMYSGSRRSRGSMAGRRPAKRRGSTTAMTSPEAAPSIRDTPATDPATAPTRLATDDVAADGIRGTGVGSRSGGRGCVTVAILLRVGHCGQLVRERGDDGLGVRDEPGVGHDPDGYAAGVAEDRNAHRDVAGNGRPHQHSTDG